MAVENSVGASDANNCSTAVDLASRVVEQWDNHDRFRVTSEDRALWGGDEPNAIVIAKWLIKCHAALVRIRDSEFTAYQNTPEGIYGVGVCDGHRYCSSAASETVGRKQYNVRYHRAGSKRNRRRSGIIIWRSPSREA